MSSGKYKFSEKIGAGGMAEVYRAVVSGAEGFQKTVAVKRLLPNLTADQERIQMFIDEARILAGLSHPNIVQVLDFEKLGDEYLLVMEYVHGRSLSETLSRCKRRKLSLSAGIIAYIAEETASGLAYAHGKTDDEGRPLGIVHRDVSPHNILISADGLVKVTDFGIAKAVTRLSRTEAGYIKGKFGYLAPEQAAGKQVDPRSDIFALGITMFNMMTGRELFRRKSDARMIQAVLNWRGLDDSYRPQRIPSRLWEILRRILQPKPVDRYQSAEALLRDLRELRTGLPLKCEAEDLADLMAQLFGDDLTSSPSIHKDQRSLEEQIASEVDRFESLIIIEDETTEENTAHWSRPAASTELLQRTNTVRWWRGRRQRVALGGLVLAGIATLLVVILWPGGRPSDRAAEVKEPDRSPPAEQVEPVIAPEPVPAPTEEPAPEPPEESAKPAEPAEPGETAETETTPVRESTPPTDDTEKTPRVRRRPGFLVLNSSPWAYVEINGKRWKKPTPLVDLKLPPGSYKIRLFNPVVKRSKTIKVRIKSGKTTRRVVSF